MVPVQFGFWLSIEARAVAMAVVTVAATGVVDVPEIVQVPGVNAPPLPTSPLMVPGPTQVTAVVPTTVKGAAAPRLPPVLYAVELTGCTLLQGLAPDAIAVAFAAALKRAGATVVQTLSHQFPNGGQTCVLVLAESHAVLHTWPETGTINLDIFSCSSRLKSHAAIDELRQAFGAAAVSVQEISRADGHRPSTDRRR